MDITALAAVGIALGMEADTAWATAEAIDLTLSPRAAYDVMAAAARVDAWPQLTSLG